MKKVKIGIIGCGKITQVSHIPSLLEIPGKAKITALLDVNQKTVEKLKQEKDLDSGIYTSIKEFLKSDIDAVVICTPNSLHYKQSMQALEAGKHVLVEKPMATSLKQADEMIAFAKKQNLVLQVNQSLRFSAPYVKIRSLIKEGKIGDIIHLRCLRAGGSSPDKSWSPGANWFVQKKFCGGLIMDIAVHMADVLGWYAASDAKMIYAVNPTRKKNREVPDNVNAIIEYKNGATGILELSWTIPKGGGLLEIYGTKGTIRLGFDAGNIEMALIDKEFRVIKPVKTKTSHQCFIDAINGKASTPVPGEIGRQALALCKAIEKSGKTGKAVKL
jgi:predicted dehydrogenase